ncbi:hypothetical protein [Allostreptomyces psammosilenae]|uniref:Uncharacterized protein n=1 Tax=Allostreptomyces psammosilenae TaxID=1892865 RepID=A0A853AC45_9ACTN|nr:hypothetical protein [Allostreptomyces psammosilenae]NYI07942.1 hypothetical protein [Allostreptomyces psammosilenae]
MHYPKPATTWRVGGLLLLLLAVTAIGAPWPSQAEARGDAPAAVEQYLGRWNYDLPDRATMANIATSDLPGRSRVPQVGDVVFTAEDARTVVGRTDVGCTWRFRVTPDSLELHPSNQLCHNPTAGVSYTIHQWTVTVGGARERETIVATSHHPQGDYSFVLRDGTRTRADEYDPRAAAKFTGSWAHDPADLEEGVNVRTTVRTAPDGTRTVERSAEQGELTISRDYGHRITARTGDGCTWSLVARGNTAKLDPPIQTCTRSESGAITLRSWTIATDGVRQASVMTGTDEHGGEFALGGGSLHRP